MSMSTIEDLFLKSPYSLKKDEKNLFFNNYLSELTDHHLNNCESYKKILSVLDYDHEHNENFQITPSIPVRLFKEYNLKSVSSEDIIKTMTSSGTSGQAVSKIFLDRTTSTNQTKTLAKILGEFLGSKRLPMLIIDTKDILKDRNNFSARAAGILGFRTFGRDAKFALNSDMSINFNEIEAFLEKYKNEDILVFGFTSIIWEHFHKPLLGNSKNQIKIPKGILIHGGGWKKLESESVDSQTFRSEIYRSCGMSKIHNYYGMIEQTGSIYMECEEGHLHCSNFSDIDIYNNDFELCPMGQTGLVKLYSILPYSYPGHIILTEDIGEIVGEDDCKCGRLGKYFKIHGRVKNAEIRGCSDTYKSERS